MSTVGFFRKKVGRVRVGQQEAPWGGTVAGEQDLMGAVRRKCVTCGEGTEAWLGSWLDRTHNFHDQRDLAEECSIECLNGLWRRDPQGVSILACRRGMEERVQIP